MNSVFVIEQNVDYTVKDRWGNTPLSEASKKINVNNNFKDICTLLESLSDD